MLYASITLSVLGCVVFLACKYLLRKPADLSKDLILITGAASGIGRLLAILLSKYCDRIIALDKDIVGLEETASRVSKQHNVSLICYECDISNRNAIKKCAADIRRDHGRVTMLINNAAIVNGNFLLDIPSVKVEKLIQVNFLAPFYLVKEFLPGMLGSAYETAMECIPQSLRVIPAVSNTERCFGNPAKGHLVFLSSVASQTICPGLSDYCASKAGLSAMAETLRLEMEALEMSKSIAVTDIRPFLIDTGMFEGFDSRLPVLPILEPEEVAKRIVKAIRYRERTVYIPWITWFIPLVHRILPYPVLVIMFKISGALDGMRSFKRANKKHD
ncbi:epidermal retinal dehydrogenase 2 [Echinococcus multilocularis]|uniref:Epidermal retinal dehydrogenase 2 n=1 Tax=Echinococcus multilocularis TaxID=6211 RepID=A0A068YIU0_ECHMU|nr:epidermal retinal dehydrogenase 2 [Echinococcus multilocularis]